jgi:hypothetical protein
MINSFIPNPNNKPKATPKLVAEDLMLLIQPGIWYSYNGLRSLLKGRYYKGVSIDMLSSAISRISASKLQSKVIITGTEDWQQIRYFKLKSHV